MKKLLYIIPTILTIFLGIGIIGLIPMQFIGKNTIEELKKINIELKAKNAWNFKPLEMNIENNDIGLIINLREIYQIYIKSRIFKKKAFADNVIFMQDVAIQIIINDNKKDFNIEEIYQILQKSFGEISYDVSLENAIIQIIFNDDIKKTVLQDFFIKRIYFSKDKQESEFNMDIHSELNDLVEFQLISKKDSFGLKIKSNNANCRIYLESNKGQFICDIGNFENLINEFGINKNFSQYNFLKNSNLSFNADVLNDIDDRIGVSGSIKINDNKGEFSTMIDSKKMDFNIKFPKLILTKEAINSIEISDQKNQKIESSMLFENRNPYLEDMIGNYSYSSSNIKDLTKMIFAMLFNNKTINFKTKIDEILTEKSSFIDLFGDISIAKNSLLINKISTKFNENSILNISENSIKIYGNKFEDFIKLTNFQYFNQNLHEELYNIRGNILNNNNIFEFNINKIEIGNKEIGGLNYRLSDEKSDGNHYKREQKIIFKNINFQEIFNMDLIFKELNRNFWDFNDVEKQEGIIIDLISKKNRNEILENKELEIKILNCSYRSNLLEDFELKYKIFPKKVNFLINSNSSILDGNFILDFSFINTIKPMISIESNIKKLDYSIFSILDKDFTQANGFEFFQNLNHDRDYHIPSLIGIFGDGKIDIKNIQNGDFKNLNLLFKISDGNIYVENLSIDGIKESLYGNKIAVNSNISLRGYPKFEIAFATQNVNLKNILNTNLNGDFDLRGKISTSGVNPRKIIQNLNGNISGEIENLKLDNFDLEKISGPNLNFLNSENFEKILKSGNLFVKKSNIMMNILNGKLNGNINGTEGFFSGNFNYNIDLENNVLTNFAGNFAIMAKNKDSTKTEKFIPLYIPLACNGILGKLPNCIIDFQNIRKYLN